GALVHRVASPVPVRLDVRLEAPFPSAGETTDASGPDAATVAGGPRSGEPDAGGVDAAGTGTAGAGEATEFGALWHLPVDVAPGHEHPPEPIRYDTATGRRGAVIVRSAVAGTVADGML